MHAHCGHHDDKRDQSFHFYSIKIELGEEKTHRTIHFSNYETMRNARLAILGA